MFQFKLLVEAGELGIPPDFLLAAEAGAIRWSIIPARKGSWEKRGFYAFGYPVVVMGWTLARWRPRPHVGPTFQAPA